MERIRLVIEFRRTDIEDIKLYSKLMKFERPAVMVKEILKGKVGLDVLEDKED